MNKPENDHRNTFARAKWVVDLARPNNGATFVSCFRTLLNTRQKPFYLNKNKIPI